MSAAAPAAAAAAAASPAIGFETTSLSAQGGLTVHTACVPHSDPTRKRYFFYIPKDKPFDQCMPHGTTTLKAMFVFKELNTTNVKTRQELFEIFRNGELVCVYNNGANILIDGPLVDKLMAKQKDLYAMFSTPANPRCVSLGGKFDQLTFDQYKLLVKMATGLTSSFPKAPAESKAPSSPGKATGNPVVGAVAPTAHAAAPAAAAASS